LVKPLLLFRSPSITLNPKLGSTALLSSTN
jgi:hypothetical protein